VVAQLVGTPAGPRAALDHHDVVARTLQPQRGAEPAQPGADHDDPHRSHSGRRPGPPALREIG
jgi:hypothetical protein